MIEQLSCMAGIFSKYQIDAAKYLNCPIGNISEITDRGRDEK
jgi:hypothetical protein